MITSAKTIAEQFESLGGGSLNLNGWGFGCEFGYWQRSLHLEPLGLLRWASISPDNLLRGLEAGFAEVEDEAALELRALTGSDWGYTQTTYGLYMDHSGMEQDKVPAAQAKATLAKSMGFLRDKLLQDLALGEKLFVYRTYDHIVDDGMQCALADAIGRLGKGVLCYVQHAVEGRLPFTAVRKTPNLIVGYIDHFAPVEGRLDYNPIGWEAVCRAALDVWPTEIQTQRAPSGMDYLALNQPAFQTPPPAGSGARRLPRLRRWLGL